MTKRIVTNRPSFQGDLCVRRIDAIPEGMVSKNQENGVHILAHSETGHHHVIDSRNAQLLIDSTNDFIAYLDVEEETIVKHLRDFDTHGDLTLPPGKYEIRRQREYIPEGWRKSQD